MKHVNKEKFMHKSNASGVLKQKTLIVKGMLAVRSGSTN